MQQVLSSSLRKFSGSRLVARKLVVGLNWSRYRCCLKGSRSLREEDIIYLDNHIFAVNKPSGILTQGDKTGDQSLLELAKAYLKKKFSKKGKVFLGLVHRLDRPTSGVVCFARTSKAAARLSAGMRDRSTRKEYLVVVEGHLDRSSGKLTNDLWQPDLSKNVVKVLSGRSNDTEKQEAQQAVLDQKIATKKAILHFERLGIFGDQTILRVQLISGRKHQIRVQLASLGHPIVGDAKYGARRGSGPLPGRAIALHALRMRFRHPVLRRPSLAAAGGGAAAGEDGSRAGCHRQKGEEEDARAVLETRLGKGESEPEMISLAAPPPSSWGQWLSTTLAGCRHHSIGNNSIQALVDQAVKDNTPLPTSLRHK